MAGDEGRPTGRRRPGPTTERGLDRVVNFSDAVVAIAITLIILPLVDLAQEHDDGSVVAFFGHNWTGLAAAALSFVVVPSGSLTVMLTRSAPAVVTGRQSMPAARSSWTNGSSSGAGSTAIEGMPALIDAREMLTPLPPACEMTDSERITVPRSSGPPSATVRSWLGLGVRVTIMRRRPRRRRPRAPRGRRVASRCR